MKYLKLENLEILTKLNLDKNIKQIVLVIATPKSHTGYLYTYEKNDTWLQVLDKTPVVIGKKGFTIDKTEGDGKSPLGLHKIGHAFGIEAPKHTKMPYKQITPDDKFIDDPESDEYNTWVQGETKAKSYEIMKRDDNQYDLGLIIEYNMHPVIKYGGSAIFMHIWKNSNKATAGCVAMDRLHLEDIIGWLEPIKNPHLYMLSR